MRERYFCCLLSNIAYYQKDIISTIFSTRPLTKQNRDLDSCTSKPKFHESDKDAQCFTVCRNNKLYIAFRGTESIRDCLSDANIIRVPMDLPTINASQRPYVHWGFLRQFRSLQKDIENDITEYINDNNSETKELVITGHSLGAAQATLASLEFKLQYPKMIISCYTYGSPRVGDDAFINLFEKNINHYERFVNEEDPVTLIPFAWRFSHLPNFIYLNENGNLCSNIKENRWWSMIKDLFEYLFFGEENPLGDHSCNDYLCKLENIDE